MGALFGTDGVRGRWGSDLTEDLVRSLGYAATRVLGASRVLIGRDTRSSGDPIEHALASGIAAAGGHALMAEVIPTPAVAVLTRAYGCDAGAVISASHNPADDNGIKFFGPDGMKLPDAVEDEIESAMDGTPPGDPLGESIDDAEERYMAFLLEGETPMKGLRVVVDCAHGAAYRVAPEAYRRAGAIVTALGIEPDGRNINDGYGSTHPEKLQEAVLESGADAGIAHDGDADRMIAVDERGKIVDGDQAIAICALEARTRGALPGNAVVSTVMANLGFRRAMSRNGIEVVETAVGDRYVLEAMRERGLAIGGEQSGHVIFLDKHTTGDGILTALRLLGIVASSGKKLSELAAVSPRMPQALKAVRVKDKDSLASSDAVWSEVRAVEAELGDEGRVLVRASGTEPVIRVMVEASTVHAARDAVERIATAVQTTLG